MRRNITENKFPATLKPPFMGRLSRGKPRSISYAEGSYPQGNLESLMATKKPEVPQSEIPASEETTTLPVEQERPRSKPGAAKPAEVAAASDKPSAQELPPRDPLSQPVYRSELVLNSMQAQRVVRRSFVPLSGSLFRSDVILRIISNDQAADELEEIIRDFMNPVMVDLKKSLEQSKYLLDENGIEAMPDYTHVRTEMIEVKSPQAATFSRMISLLDQLMICIDALWFNGVLTNKQRSIQTITWQQRLLKMANRIIDFEKRARRRAYDAGMQEQVDLHAPQADQDDAENQISDALKETDDDSPVPGVQKDASMAAV